MFEVKISQFSDWKKCLNITEGEVFRVISALNFIPDDHKQIVVWCNDEPAVMRIHNWRDTTVAGNKKIRKDRERGCWKLLFNIDRK